MLGNRVYICITGKLYFSDDKIAIMTVFLMNIIDRACIPYYDLIIYIFLDSVENCWVFSIFE